MTDKKNAETSEPMSNEEVDDIVEKEPKKDFDDLVEPDATNELPTNEEIEEIIGEEKENDSL